VFEPFRRVTTRAGLTSVKAVIAVAGYAVAIFMLPGNLL
jgi:hypothetical protein